MGYIETADLVEATSFRRRLLICLVQSSGIVLNESEANMPKAQFDKRIALARDVLSNPEAFVSRFIWPVVSNTSIASTGIDSTDSDLEYVVLSFWDIIAGVTNDDKIEVTL